MPGITSLREAIACKTEAMYGISFNAETEITVTAGATQAIFTAISAFVNEGEEGDIQYPCRDYELHLYNTYNSQTGVLSSEVLDPTTGQAWV